jgi:hypothetical protein
MDRDIYVLTGAEGLSIIQQQKNAFEVILKGEDFPVSQLTAEFLNVKTRSKTTTPYYFVKIKPFSVSTP